jgi:23S rRNA (adenine2503-C2)-methyltransferase
MPVNRKYPLSALFDALRTYQERTGERITFEYVLIDKVNDMPELAYELAALLNGLDAYVNFIPCSPVAEKYGRPPEGRVKAFCAPLKQLKIEYEIRKEKGTDINAACGQLRTKAPRGGAD